MPETASDSDRIGVQRSGEQTDRQAHQPRVADRDAIADWAFGGDSAAGWTACRGVR